jgi:putative drug exporter of the RND superfamily
VSRSIKRLAGAVTGPRGRWGAIGAWVVLGIGGFFAHAHLGSVTTAGQSSFLPRKAGSTRVVDVLQRSYRGGNDIPVLIVFNREGGLTEGDLNAIDRLGRGLERLGLTGATPVFAPYSGDTNGLLGKVATIAKGVGPVSRDREAALLALAINAAKHGAIAGVGKIREYLRAHRRPGLRSYVTGPGALAEDLERVADDAGKTLLLAALGLILVLLLLIYRAPILAVLPLLVVAAAYLAATGVVYLLIKAGAITVNVEGTLLLLVLIFGAGTDYSMLLVHRYREEIGGGREPAAALPAAVAESGPAIAASAATVIAAMLVLLVAELESTHWLGPVLGVGIAVMLVASFTLLPALLALLGERAFWPARPARAARGRISSRHAGGNTSSIGAPEASEAEPDRRWVALAGLVRRRPRSIVAAVSALLVLLALGNLVDHGTIGFGQGEIGSTESSRGTKVLDEHFPPGMGSPLTAVVDAEQATSAVEGLTGLHAVKLVSPVAPSAGKAVLAIVLRGNPYAGAAAAEVEDIRDRLREVAPSALVGGLPAENLDIEQTNARDTRLIVPLALLVVVTILALVLWALVAPAYLIVTVVASFAATLGLVTFAFAELLGSSGIAFNLVLTAFIFLVALGVDYNIFLMTRAREEAAKRGTRDGVLVALENTGAVVTGAGVVLAGTFATLTLLPLEGLVQIGAAVAIGVLLDTFVVRALLIPAITYLLGDRAWWPGWLSRGRPRLP